MKHVKLFTLTCLAIAFVFSGCALTKMIKLAEEQSLKVEKNPLRLKGEEVPFTLSATLPPKILPKGKVYTLKTTYLYGETEIEVGSLEFKADDFPDNATSKTKGSTDQTIAFEDAINPGVLLVQGIAMDPRNGKTEQTEKMEIAKGVITTPLFVKSPVGSFIAHHGYNDEDEYLSTNIDFFFDQGRSTLRSSLKTGEKTNRERRKNLNAFVADKNTTKTVKITGTHSPEGREDINSDLAKDRAAVVEKLYRRQMDRYNYKELADSIEFVLNPVVREWGALKAALKSSETVDKDIKEKFLNVINGTGTFEDKEKELQKIDGYKSVFKTLYPALRSSSTEVLTLKKKKTQSEIATLAASIVDGSAPADTLSTEELLYAASLTVSMKEKEALYLVATKEKDSWIAHNNLAAIHLEAAKSTDNKEMQLDYLGKAVTHLEIAKKKLMTTSSSADKGGRDADLHALQGEKEGSEVTVNLIYAHVTRGEFDEAYALAKEAKDGFSGGKPWQSEFGDGSYRD